MLLREHSSCLCRGENGKSFCLAELWPALIVRIQWDFTINAVHAFQNTKKDYFGFTHAPLKFISATRKDKHFIGQLWQLMTASNAGAWTQAWQTKWALFKIERFVLQAFPSFLPHPLPALLLASFFARSLTLVPHSLLLFNEVLGRGVRPLGPTPYSIIYHFWEKSLPCSIPSVDKWYLFHAPSLKHTHLF